MSVQHITTPLLRYTFVKGEITSGTPATGYVACGNGTAFPMLVTIKQLDEIFYRVKDARFTDGSVTNSNPAVGTLYASSSIPFDRRFDEDGAYISRGFNSQTPKPFMGAGYDSGEGYTFYDIAQEGGQWWPSWAINDRFNTGPPNYAASGVRKINTAFDYLADSLYIYTHTGSVNPNYWFNPEPYSLGRVVVGDRVAVVKDDETDGLFAPTNKFYLEIFFEAQWANNILGWGGQTMNTIPIPSPATWLHICDYKIQLSPSGGSNYVSCPFYIYHADGSAYDDWDSGVDFVHEAIDWWPYAKGVPATPVWNVSTGEKL